MHQVADSFQRCPASEAAIRNQAEKLGCLDQFAIIRLTKVVGANTPPFPQWLNDWESWPSLKAVSEEHVYFIPPDLVQRQTPRTLIGTKQMCEHIAKARVD